MFGVLRLMKRICPKCHREQTVPGQEIGKAVPCKYCGAMMQPCHKDAGHAASGHKITLFHPTKKHRGE